jgi:hypothetical protein
MYIHKTFGTYQLVEDDGDRYYECRHMFSGQTCTASTIKEAKKVLDDLDLTHHEIRTAISKLNRYGYQVVKVIA